MSTKRNIITGSLTAIIFVACIYAAGSSISNTAKAKYEDYAPKPVLYCEGKTVAEVIYDDDGNMVHCILHEVEEDADTEPLIRASGLPVKYPNFKTMLQLIGNCTKLAMPHQNTTESSPSNTTDYSSALWSPWSLWNGIVPGTKWCGVGDIADSFEQLGTQCDVDSCCRAHDHCPVKLKAFRSGYGLINLSLYTKSHCDCDREFYDCLKESRNKLADAVGNFYFNFMKVQCLRERKPFICIENRTETDGSERCVKWAEDENSKKMQVTVTQLEY